MAVLVLACGTRIYYHFAVRNRNFVALISDLLLVISWAPGAPGPHLPLSQPHVCMAACLFLIPLNPKP